MGTPLVSLSSVPFDSHSSHAALCDSSACIQTPQGEVHAHDARVMHGAQSVSASVDAFDATTPADQIARVPSLMEAPPFFYTHHELTNDSRIDDASFHDAHRIASGVAPLSQQREGAALISNEARANENLSSPSCSSGIPLPFQMPLAQVSGFDQVWPQPTGRAPSVSPQVPAAPQRLGAEPQEVRFEAGEHALPLASNPPLSVQLLGAQVGGSTPTLSRSTTSSRMSTAEFVFAQQRLAAAQAQQQQQNQVQQQQNQVQQQQQHVQQQQQQQQQYAQQQ